MKISDKMTARGSVDPSFVCLEDGRTIRWDNRHNTLSYDAAKSMAKAFGGDNSLIPNRIGIIYGGSDASFDTITRDQSWSELHDELQSKKCDVQVQSFSYSPSLVQIEDSGASSSGSTGWGIMFHAHSDSTTAGEFGTAKSDGSSTPEIFKSGTTILQAVLLNKSGDDYTILARVSLANKDGGYNTKPNNFEVALDWTVKFF